MPKAVEEYPITKLYNARVEQLFPNGESKLLGPRLSTRFEMVNNPRIHLTDMYYWPSFLPLSGIFVVGFFSLGLGWLFYIFAYFLTRREWEGVYSIAYSTILESMNISKSEWCLFISEINHKVRKYTLKTPSFMRLLSLPFLVSGLTFVIVYVGSLVFPLPTALPCLDVKECPFNTVKCFSPYVRGGNSSDKFCFMALDFNFFEFGIISLCFGVSILTIGVHWLNSSFALLRKEIENELPFLVEKHFPYRKDIRIGIGAPPENMVVKNMIKFPTKKRATDCYMPILSVEGNLPLDYDSIQIQNILKLDLEGVHAFTNFKYPSRKRGNSDECVVVGIPVTNEDYYKNLLTKAV